MTYWGYDPPDLILARIAKKMADRDPRPSEEEYREAFQPYTERAMIIARIDEARKMSSAALTERMLDLGAELSKCEGVIRAAG
jgi:hypothetical protein